MDFEISFFNAVRNVFPDIETRGCNFYFSQIVVKFIYENKILPFYKNADNFKTFVKYLMILAFVPEEKVEEEFTNLKLLKKEMQDFELILYFFVRNFIKNKNKINHFGQFKKELLITFQQQQILARPITGI
ncbi:hypothetical protein DMUE_4121 [Dictyocoela muelleri]|nr:hypothetical protein DMUE_4121 [Dictyocoela muelleri]